MSKEKKVLNFILNTLFPKFCLFCQKEENYLCSDCQALLEISENFYCLCLKPLRLPKPGKCKNCSDKKINGLYFALPYQNKLVQKLIHDFKYEPFIKELKENLALLLKNYLTLNNLKINQFSNFVIIPVPLDKKRLRWRGFNQAEEIAKELNKFLKLPLFNDVLLKTKRTIPQVNLSAEEREKNLERAFSVSLPEKIKDKDILLIDDVYTTGSTLNEAAKTLKEAGAKSVWGMVIARG
jgi:ComF family protein